MAIYDYYITELNNRQKGGKDEGKRRLFHKFIWHTCSRHNRTITTITGVIFNYLEILEYRLKTPIENPKETAVVMNVIWNHENKSKRPRGEPKVSCFQKHSKRLLG